MDSKPETAPAMPAYAGVIAVALTAIGWWFTTNLQPIWWAAWLAPLPLLVFAIRTRARWAALATFLAFALGDASLWHYLHDVVRLPLAVTVAAAIIMPALLMLPAVLLFRALVLRGRTLTAVFALPVATTGLAWLSAATSPHGTFGNMAYSQMDALPVIQIAAVTGLWGIGFLVWLLPSTLVVMSSANIPARQRWIAACAGGGVLAIALAGGAWRLHDDATTQHVRIGLVSIGTGKDAQADLAEPEGERMLARYLAEIDRLAAEGAQVVVAPESALLVHSHAIAALQALSTQRRVRILIGAEDHSDAQIKHNAALVFEPDRDAPAAYDKHHLIPGYEDRYTPGDASVMLDGTPRTGIAICKDLDFTDTSVAYGKRAAHLMLVPAWDFGEDAWLHARMAVLRGVEGGFAIARSARNGLLTLSDDRGRVVAQASSVGIDAPASLVGDLPLRETRTPYTRWGDAFGWLCLAAATVLAVNVLRRRPRRG